MMKHEFDEIAGFVCDPEMYNNEIEPTYMAFDKVEKKGLAKAYWGNGDRRVAKDGGYGLWTQLNDLRREMDKYKEGLNPSNYLFRTNVEKIAEIFRKSDEIVEKINRL